MLSVLLFCINILEKVSRLTLLSVHRNLWLKSWSSEPACKSRLKSVPFKGEWFNESLNKVIKQITWGKVLLAHKKQSKPSATTAITSSQKRDPLASPMCLPIIQR